MHSVLNMIHSTPTEQSMPQNDKSNRLSPSTHSGSQNSHVRREMPSTDASLPPTVRYKPLPSILIDFIAITLCDIIPFRQPTRRRSQPSLAQHATHTGRPMPELVYFIQKITYQARINCRTALVALIYLNRAKAALPRNAVASYDTCHRMLLGALLLASKYLQDSDWAPNYDMQDPQYYHGQSTRHSNRPLTNKRLCDMCSGLYTLEDINQLERAFLKLIQYRLWLDDKDINNFVLQHRTDLGL